VSENLPLLCFFYITTNIDLSFYVNTALDIVTIVLEFAKYLSFYLTIFTCTYRGTHTQAHIYNQHTRGMATTKHRSLVERGGKGAFVRDIGLAPNQKNMSAKPVTRILKGFLAHRASSKTTRPFLTKQ